MLDAREAQQGLTTFPKEISLDSKAASFFSELSAQSRFREVSQSLIEPRTRRF